MNLPTQLVFRPEHLHLQDPPADPPMRTGSDQAPAQTSEPGTAQPGAAPEACGWQAMWPMLLIFAVLYFLMIRPQQKQEKARRAMLAAIKKGDKVVTTGGVHGTITSLSDNTAILRVDNIKMTVDRAAVARVVSGDGEGPAS